MGSQRTGCQALTGQAPLPTEPLPAPSRIFYLLLFNVCVCMSHLYWGAAEAVVSHWILVLGTELLVGPLEERYCNGSIHDLGLSGPREEGASCLPT